MDKVSIIRSICHKDPNHGGQPLYDDGSTHTGSRLLWGLVTFHPSFGSMISYDRGIRDIWVSGLHELFQGFPVQVDQFSGRSARPLCRGW